MTTKALMTILAVFVVVGSTTAWVLAQPTSTAAPLTDDQVQRIRPLLQSTEAESARAQARLAECQRELAALYADYHLDEAAVRKLQEEIVQRQRQLLASHHRMQQALRAIVTPDQFERLRRRLDQASAPSPSSEGRPKGSPR